MQDLLSLPSVWPVFVGCNRMSEVSEVQGVREKNLDSIGAYDYFGWNGSEFRTFGYGFSRYGGTVYAVTPVELDNQQRYLLGRKLKSKDFGSGELPNGYSTTISEAYYWQAEDHPKKKIYVVEIYKEILPITPFEWMQTARFN